MNAHALFAKGSIRSFIIKVSLAGSMLQIVCSVASSCLVREYYRISLKFTQYNRNIVCIIDYKQ